MSRAGLAPVHAFFNPFIHAKLLILDNAHNAGRRGFSGEGYKKGTQNAAV